MASHNTVSEHMTETQHTTVPRKTFPFNRKKPGKDQVHIGEGGGVIADDQLSKGGGEDLCDIQYISGPLLWCRLKLSIKK